MQRPVGVAAVALLVVAGFAVVLARRSGTEIPVYPEAVGEPGPALPPRAILAFGTGVSGAEVAILSADGRIDFLDRADGKTLRTVESGAKEWTLSFRNPGGREPRDDKYRTPDELALGGLPAFVSGGRVAAVREDALLDFEWAGESRILLAAPWLRGAPLLVHGGPGTPVLVVLADGRVARVTESEARLSESRIEGRS